MPEQTIVRVVGLRGEYINMSTGRNGDVTVYGPVIWSEKAGRYVRTGQHPGYHAITPDRVRPCQLAMKVTA